MPRESNVTLRMVSRVIVDVSNLTAHPGVQQERAAAERKKLTEWISPLNPFVRHNEIIRKRQEGTGEWFVAQEQVLDWVLSRGWSLWCYGIRMWFSGC